MRESIGGAWLFGIVTVFIFFFAAFLAYSISYTRAFNLKNEIINVIEQNEVYTVSTAPNLIIATDAVLEKSAEGRIFKLVKSMGYNYSSINKQCEGNNNRSKEGGYCLVKVCAKDSSNHFITNHNTHYKVTTYIALTLPVVNIDISIPITGETRTLYDDGSGYPCTEGL